MLLNSLELQHNLNKLNKVIQRRPPLLILNNVLLECRNNFLYLTGYDGINLLQVKQDFEGKDINALVNFQDLKNLIRTHKTTTELLLEDKKLFISSGKNKAKLSLALGNYPNVKLSSYPKFNQVDPVLFEQMIATFTRFGQSNETDVSKIVKANEYCVFTDDCTRIVVYRTDLFNTNLPVSIFPILKHLRGAENIKFGTDDVSNWFIIDNVLVRTAKLVTIEYPAWQNIIPTTRWQIKLNRKELLEHLKSFDNIDGICHMLLQDDKLTFLAQNNSVEAEFEVILATEQEPFFIKVNIKSLVAVLSYYGIDEIEINIGQLTQGNYILKFLGDLLDYYMVTE